MSTKTKTRVGGIIALANKAGAAEEKFTGISVTAEAGSEPMGVGEETAEQNDQRPEKNLASAQVRESSKASQLEYAKKNLAFEGERTTNVGLYVSVKEKLEDAMTVTRSRGTIQDLVNNIIVEWLDSHQDELNKLARKVKF